MLAGLRGKGKTTCLLTKHMITVQDPADPTHDLANMLNPHCKGNIKVVASTTWEEYRKYFEKDRALW